MKLATAVLAAVLATGLVTATDAEARRLGGARSSGMQRQQAPQPAHPTNAQPGTPAQAAPATAGAAAATPAAAAPKRSWAGPLAGLAAGLGLAALASAFGFGPGLANFMLIALLVMVGLAVFGLLMRKRAAAAVGPLAAAGRMSADTSSELGDRPAQTRIGSALPGATAKAAVPADFDAAAFARSAKTQFMALQSANDAGDLERLRDYLTPEMHEVVAQDLRERGGATQHTEVFGLEATVVEVVEDADRYVVSVRFTGSARDQPGAEPEDLDETWHLTKPRTGFGGWVVAGIQQTEVH
ncbi:MAG TPA: Tim44-like domain-containing protein [Ramlibacter sp.]|uniref:Tim44 domain-containing protein n=1 Tax=Ramlibacter sp. TaxID=1917967 RepID=UPI002B5CBC8E|nr:Tim44-like domain-containing protein [Ramlibacter sp.]HVZ46825.1 Tim44-like domain-containing protein [Ramlibacter sp.]